MSPEAGLPAERTAMAWQRTVLGLGGVSALLLHHADGTPVAWICGTLGVLAAFGVLALVEVRFLRRRPGTPEDAPMGRGLVRGIATITVLLSLASLVVVMS